ncbi:MAG: hypothetical protein DRP99_02975 [Candidatus Latescibacterota bacterium]|nr:MAG: hypothetical protein DRP99_02975 [Candidatus Latescibacterota bacterium]
MSRATKARISREAMLRSRPVRNSQVRWELDDNGEVVITLELKKDWKTKLLSKLFYIPKRRRISLDEVGSRIWELCDGDHTVRDLIEFLRKRYKLNPKEAEVSLTNYLKQLGKKRLVAFAVPMRKG